jgi:hypothetical protein
MEESKTEKTFSPLIESADLGDQVSVEELDFVSGGGGIGVDPVGPTRG